MWCQKSMDREYIVNLYGVKRGLNRGGVLMSHGILKKCACPMAL